MDEESGMSLWSTAQPYTSILISLCVNFCELHKSDPTEKLLPLPYVVDR